MKKRVAILVGVPTPYREPLFERLARSADYNILALYCRERQPSQGWRLGEPLYPARYLRNLAPPGWHGRLLIGNINPGVAKELRAFRPDAVVVYGYNSATTLRAILWASKHRVPVLMRSDSNLLDEQGKAPHVLVVKRWFMGWLTQRVSGFLSVGTSNSRYWLRYGAKPEKIFLAHYAVDNDFFRSQAARYRPCREQIRDENGWRQRYLLLYVGRLAVEKGVDVLIEAVRGISRVRPDIGLLIVGEGPERKWLEKQAQNLPQVFFLGFHDWKDLPRFYAAADLLVLPSKHEQWGLVVNEAMASGLPVLATRKVGAAQDLIIEGQSGYVVPEDDAEAMASAIDRACQSEERLRAMGEGAQQLIASWNYDATLKGFYRALASCLGREGWPTASSVLSRPAMQDE
jgi:glycosyltransferase involved in cell wall biosynthesis